MAYFHLSLQSIQGVSLMRNTKAQLRRVEMYTAVAPASWYTGRSRALWAHGLVRRAVQETRSDPRETNLAYAGAQVSETPEGIELEFFSWAQDEPEPSGISGVELGSQLGTGTTPSRDP